MASIRLIVLAALWILPGWARAEQLVVFDDGREMLVESARAEAGMTLLALAGGGRIAVPQARIVEIRAHEERPAPGPAESVRARQAGNAWRGAAGEFADLIAGAADRHQLDPALLTAVAMVESAFDPLAVSPKGAQGLLQLMPATADRFGVRDAFDAAQNVEAGATYLRWLLERFEGDTSLALAGYNAGEAAVDRHRGIPPYRETRSYVSKVLAGMTGFQTVRR
jgi:soluble lytic murein transglycosylase-like protein